MTDDPLPLIGVIAKLDLKPTDIIVIKTRDIISEVAAERIGRHFAERLNLPNKVVVLAGLDIEVLSPTGEAIPS